MVPGAEASLRHSSQWIVQKNLIHDQRQPMFRADLLQDRPLRGLGVVPSRIIWVHQRNRSSPQSNPLPQRSRIKMPTVVVKERISDQTNIVQIGQKIKERIARLGDQHLIARIAKQPKQDSYKPRWCWSSERYCSGSTASPDVQHSSRPPLPSPAAILWVRIVIQRLRRSQRTPESPRHHTRIRTEWDSKRSNPEPAAQPPAAPAAASPTLSQPYPSPSAAKIAPSPSIFSQPRRALSIHVSGLSPAA